MPSAFRSSILCAFLMLSACPPVVPVGDSGVLGGGAGGGGVSEDAGCEGRVGCACVGGACTTGECVAGQCVACTRGEASCSCLGNQTCNAGLRCANAVCETCTPGQLGCACDAQNRCAQGASCMNQVCVTETCVPGAAQCPCRPNAPKCNTALACDNASLCQTCSNDIIGCACVGNVCTGQTTCDTTTQLCRAQKSCATLLTEQTCLPNQLCNEATNGSDATCVPMTCVAGFKFTGVSCTACVSANCANEPNCGLLSDGGVADGGLISQCKNENRECVEMGAVATCGACLPGFTLSGTTCVNVPKCGTVTCSVSEYCDRTASPTCVALPCPAGQAKGSTGLCAACFQNCIGAGFSGRVWPFRTPLDGCLCETLDNWFLPAGGAGTATKCDADDDGWVREEADDDLVRGDPARRANSRCNIVAPTRARLFDETGMSIDVISCTEGMIKASVALVDGGVPNGGFGLFADGGLRPLRDGGTACSGLVPMRLLETQRNDVPGRPMGTGAPAYGIGTSGRLLEASELNALTKACVSSVADFNDNGAEDLIEVQSLAPVSDQERLKSFSHFIELQSATVSGDVLTIRERSRCQADFSLRYDPLATTANPIDNYSNTDDTPYWRSCSRSRDPRYDSSIQAPGFDFAQFTCDNAQAGCPIIAPPHSVLSAPTNPQVTLLRNHGLCRLGNLPPADKIWRGLNHHSQFKCVNVVSTPMNTTVDKVASDFAGGNGKLTFNTCAAKPCNTPNDPACSTPLGTGKQSRKPVVTCTATTTPTVGLVGFAAVNYRPYRFGDMAYTTSSYSGGCVNEDDTFNSYLCPYPEFSLDKTRADAQFGRYSCYGRGSNFLWCATPCVPARATMRWGPSSNGSVLR